MLAIDKTLPRGDRRASDASRLQPIESDRDADKIEDAIDRADLMKMNLLDRNAVTGGFRLTQLFKQAIGDLFGPFGDRAGIDNLLNVREMPMSMLVRRIDLDLDGGEAPLRTRSTRSLPGKPRDSTPWRTTSSGTPTSIKPASIMSPLIPLKQSIWRVLDTRHAPCSRRIFSHAGAAVGDVSTWRLGLYRGEGKDDFW